MFQTTCDVTITARAEWEAREPRAKVIRDVPQVGIVIIHHTSRAHCEKPEDCATEMREMQDAHMDERGKLIIPSCDTYCMSNYILLYIYIYIRVICSYLRSLRLWSESALCTNSESKVSVDV